MSLLQWRLLRRGLAVLVGLFIMWLSLRPGGAGPSLINDKVGHFLAYFLWTFIVAQTSKGTRRLSLYVGIIIVAGIGIEIVQPWFGRSREVMDGVADIMGVAAGLGLGLRLKPYIRHILLSSAGSS